MSKVSTYFVLNKLLNGEEGNFAKTCGVGAQQADGWYWIVDDGMADGMGPYTSKEAALRAGNQRKGDDLKPDDDEVDLSKATLFLDSNRGRYIPQHFAQEVARQYVTGVSDEDYKTLLAGPDHTAYWEAWADVLDNATINDPKLGECYLHQDGDLWVVPVTKETKEETKTVLGYTFKPFEKSDWDGYAGADKGSLICHADHADLILCPDGTISEIGYIEVTNQSWQYDWKKTKVI